jgi:hypothetical protein
VGPKFNPAKPFITSSLDIVGTELPPPPSPNPKPSRSSRLEVAVPFAAGDATRCGVPASPSRPDSPEGGCFCKDAGAEPSKSMSRRFSRFDCGGAWPLTAAAAAAAAIGFSLAFSCCSLRPGQLSLLGLDRNILNCSLLHSLSTKPTLPKEGLRRLMVYRRQSRKFGEKLVQ